MYSSLTMLSFIGYQVAITGADDSSGAILFREESWEPGDEVWLPRSQIEIDYISPAEHYMGTPKIEVHIPDWLARKKDLA